MSDVARLVETYYSRVDAHRDDVFDLFHPEVTYKRPGYPLLQGLEELRTFYRDQRVISSGRHEVVSVFVGAEGKVAVEGRFEGRLKDGTRVDLPFSDFFDLDLDHQPHLIVARRTYFDDEQV